MSGRKQLEKKGLTTALGGAACRPCGPVRQRPRLQQILALHGGQLDNFHPAPGARPRPPPAVRRFLARATLEQLQGTLVELLAAMRER